MDQSGHEEILEFTILGCGSSGGVPRIGNDWGECDPHNPKNRRLRCSLLLQRINESGQRTTVLIDTGPDIREQLVRTEVSTVDAVLYTHPHADHLHGIDDLRQIAIRTRQLVPVYMDDSTSKRAHEAFGYCFTTVGEIYRPILNEHRIYDKQRINIKGAGGSIHIIPYRVNHGDIDALMFRIGNVLYTPDVKAIPDESLEALEQLEVWLVDSLRRQIHPTHFCFEDAIDWIQRVNPTRAILTNMHTDLDYDTMCHELPDGIEPAYDGLKFQVNYKS